MDWAILEEAFEYYLECGIPFNEAVDMLASTYQESFEEIGEDMTLEEAFEVAERVSKEFICHV